MSLDGKVILVTGAASGIGAATVALIRARGGIAIATDLAGTDTILDVTSGQAWDKVIAATVAGHGRIDGLVSNAGITGAQALVDLDLTAFRQMTAVNVEGSFLGIQQVVAQMRAQGTPAQGSIVVTSSVKPAKPTGRRLPTSSCALMGASIRWSIRRAASSPRSRLTCGPAHEQEPAIDRMARRWPRTSSSIHSPCRPSTRASS